jgi:hypothetical protein
VAAWLADVLASTGETIQRLEPVKERPWGAVSRIETQCRTLYFKAVGPGGRHEVRILADLAGWTDLVPDVLAADQPRGWVVLADHGTPMRDSLDGPAQLGVIESLLPAYAEMQAATAHLVGSWLEAGIPDRSVRRLPEQFERLVSGPLPIDASERRELLDGLADLERACDVLAATAHVNALDHADIHGTNVLVKGNVGRLVDWGDACISHPFSSLLVPYLFVIPLLDVRERQAATLRLRDVYLEPWGSTPETREAFGLAVWVGYVARALSNDHQTAGAAPADVAEARAEIVMLLRAWHAKRALLGRQEILFDS